MQQSDLRQLLTQPYDADRWHDVVDFVFPSTQWFKAEQPIPCTDDKVTSFSQRGNVRLADGRTLGLFEVRLDGSVNIARNRVWLRQLTSQFVDEAALHGVLAIYTQGEEDYRFTFMARDTELTEDGQLVTSETHPKRYTYVLGPNESCRTAAERFHSLGQMTELSLDAVTEAFSVESLNKEFYRHVQRHFYKLVGGQVDSKEFTGCMALPSRPIDTPENHRAYSEFAVRLLGRVIFCWFLKHKKCNKERPLIPEELLSSSAVDAHTGYYHEVLEKLFFQTLNKPMSERSKYAPEFAHLIPYLNGGLFDPHHEDFYQEGSLGQSTYLNTLTVPDEWFRDFFQTLEQYNFTIDENTTFDTEVSIDPEILGRIFENLLAEINPETGDSARKATGSFYTPREIVDYMVEESLLQNLKTSLGVEADNSDLANKLKALFAEDNEPHGFDDACRRDVIDAFRTIKVLDPACGSGAFPVGILQKMLCALRKVDPENDLWLDAQIRQIQSMDLTREEEFRRLTEVEMAFKTNEADYGRKLGIIQNSVYGVDIQPIAIEISKLRFFLTLVVDENINDQEDNRGILPLPNLDFKFVCANTLIPAPELENTTGELDLEYYPTFFEDFTRLTELYFYARTPAEKHHIRTELSSCVSKKIKGELNKVHALQGADLFEHQGLSKAKLKKIREYRSELIRNIGLWESYSNIFSGDTVGFFDPKYMFPDAAAGFNVVIANPPYVRHEEIKEYKPAFTNIYECYKGTADLLVYFYEKGCRLLKDDGILTYITSNKYFRAGYGDKLRAYLADTMTIRQLIDFGDAPVFDATAYPSIIVMQKATTAAAPAVSELLALNWTPGDPVAAFVDIFNTRAFHMEQSYLTPDGWKLEPPHIFELMQKLRDAGPPLGEYVDGKFYYGIKTGYNDAFVIDRDTRDRLIAEDPNCATIIKPFLRGRDVKRWQTHSQDLWLIFTRRGVDIEEYPAIKAHLSEYRTRLEPKPKGWKPKAGEKWPGRKAGSYEWYEIQDNIAYWKEFSRPKIIYPDIYEHQSFTFDREGFFSVNTNYFIPTDESWITGLLNSLTVEWFNGQISNRVRGGYLRAFSDYMKQIPIPSATPAQRFEIEALVEEIQARKQESPEADVTNLETEINQIVYGLFDLTPDEIALVEGVS